MAVRNLYSKRRKESNGEAPEVYTYTKLNEKLLTQIVHILREGLGGNEYKGNADWVATWARIVLTLRREHGAFSLANFSHNRHSTYLDEFINFLFSERNIEYLLDGIEVAFGELIETKTKLWFLGRENQATLAEELISELNIRFRENAVGFRFEGDEIVRVDSEYIHNEITKPTLKLLQGEWFSGAEEEFYKAHDHYRHGNAKEALSECLKSFESTMKSICVKRNWAVNGNATASNLINTCFQNGLIPPFWQSNFGSLRALLEGGVPTGRNKLAGHGQGPETVEVPDHIVVSAP